MAAPMNRGESDMVTEDFLLNLSPLLSPRWSQLCLTPSPPRSFLPSSSSMVMQYQGSNQSMDDPPQNQEHDDILDPAPYLAGDSALLQQQLRKNRSEAFSDWRPRGGGIMTMNNQGFEESNMGLEESMEMTTCFYFPPSPTNFPLYRPMPSVFFVSSEQENISLASSCQHILEDKSGLDSPINDNSFLNAGAWAPPPMQFQRMQTYTKVQKRGAVGRTIDIARYSGYEELKQDLARSFRIEGQLEDRYRVVYVDHEKDILLVGEDPWEEFLSCVHSIKILSTQEVQAMSLNIDSFTTVVDAVTTVVDAVLEKPSEYFGLVSCNATGNDEIEAVGTGSEGIGNCVIGDQARLNSRCLRKRKTKGKNLWGERRNKKTNGVRIEILSNNILQTEGMSLKDAANHLEAEVVGKWSGGTWQSDMEEGQLNSRYLGKEKKKEMTRGGEGRNKKNAISLEDILRCEEMPQKVAAKHLKVSRSTLKHNLISQSRPNATPAVVDQEGISQLNFDTLPFEQGLAATADTNSFVVKEIPKPRARPDEDLGNHEVEAVVMVGKETGEGEMEEDQLNSGPLEKGKRKEKIPQEERGSKKTNGVRIGISLEDILQNEGMSLKDAANNLNVSRSTLKRSCREYGIHRWPPRKKHKIISQSCPNESPAFVDQERITQLNSDALPTSNQVLANADTTSVTVKASYGNDTIIKFRLSRPWGMVELEQQVKKRLAGTFDIKYKDEDNEWILIACDEDLQDCISSSRPQGPTSIEVLLVPK